IKALINTPSGTFNDLKDKNDKLAKENRRLEKCLFSAEDKIKELENIIRELKRVNAELENLNKTPTYVTKQQNTEVIGSANSSKQQNQEVEDKKEQIKQEQTAKETLTVSTDTASSEGSITPKEETSVVPAPEVIMYASFPRSAGNRVYFSDLKENKDDDSFFELKISSANGRATFRPLEFMKIRNFDSAMAVMVTDGVKPNVAAVVLGIEPGEAHVEEKDYFIDKLATIKLA
ncbi:MAG: hypothetical protein KBT15_09565, partial [Bacteroidales bacterium]|nr:hypothetical protein [Candidatus Minthousia equi]